VITFALGGRQPGHAIGHCDQQSGTRGRLKDRHRVIRRLIAGLDGDPTGQEVGDPSRGQAQGGLEGLAGLGLDVTRTQSGFYTFLRGDRGSSHVGYCLPAQVQFPASRSDRGSEGGETGRGCGGGHANSLHDHRRSVHAIHVHPQPYGVNGDHPAHDRRTRGASQKGHR
jgi:hypothetical protein